MKLDCVMLYVADVPATVHFYEQAFGMQLRFMNDDHQYAQMETGEVAIAFANEESAKVDNRPIRPSRLNGDAAAVQIALISETIQEDFDRIVAAGGTVVNSPTAKPWGQMVGTVRDNNGILIEIGTPQPQDWQQDS